MQLISPTVIFYIVFGDNELRKKWTRTISDAGCRLASIVHPTVYISLKVTVETDVEILLKAVANTYSVIKDGANINTVAIVDYDSTIGFCAHVCWSHCESE